MQLDLDGEKNGEPGEADIAGAVDALAARTADALRLTRPNGFYLEATREGGAFRFATGNDRQSHRHLAATPLDAADAKAMLVDFLHDGQAWRKLAAGGSTAPAASTLTGRETFSQGTLAIAGLCFAAAFTLAGIVPYAFPVLMLAGFGVLIAVKARGEMAARRWPRVEGMVTKSETRSRRFQMDDAPPRVDVVPAVEYAFTVQGRRYTGTRIGLNTEYAGVDVAALVARYPVGARVPVYYDPGNPIDCVLEPLANKGILFDFLKLAGIAVLIGGVVYFGGAAARQWVSARYPLANATLAVTAAGIGVFLLLVFAHGLLRARSPDDPNRGMLFRIRLTQLAAVAAAFAAAAYALGLL